MYPGSEPRPPAHGVNLHVPLGLESHFRLVRHEWLYRIATNIIEMLKPTTTMLGHSRQGGSRVSHKKCTTPIKKFSLQKYYLVQQLTKRSENPPEKFHVKCCQDETLQLLALSKSYQILLSSRAKLLTLHALTLQALTSHALYPS